MLTINHKLISFIVICVINVMLDGGEYWVVEDDVKKFGACSKDHDDVDVQCCHEEQLNNLAEKTVLGWSASAK